LTTYRIISQFQRSVQIMPPD